MSTYTVISKGNCPWCKKAEDLILKKFGVVNVVSLDEEPWLKAFFSGLSLTTVPQIVTPDLEIINGYEALERYLECV
jgi:glutaredoxin